MTERRANERFEVELEAKIKSCNREFRLGCMLRNISKGGAFLKTQPELRLGERVEIQLDSGMVFVGDLVRSSGLDDTKPGFAVKFLEKGVLVREGKSLTL